MRTRSVLLATLGALLLGAAPGLADPMVFANRPVGETAGEPTLGINKDGTIFFQAMTKVMRSNDDGLHWTDVHDSALGTTLDPFIHVDVPTGRVISSQLLGACQLLAISDDAGQTWTEAPTQCGTVDHQKVGSGPWPSSLSGNPLFSRAVYTCTNHVADTGCAVSLDGGRTWGPEVTAFPGVDPSSNQGVVGGTGVCGGLEGDPVSGPDGTIYVAREYCGRPYLGVSHDAGATWTLIYVAGPAAQARPIANGANNPTVAVSPTGVLWYAWTGDDWRHHVARSADGGATWESWTIAGDTIKSTTFPYIIAGAHGVATSFAGTRDTDKGPDGAPAKAVWHLFVSSLTDEPGATWETTQVTPDDDPLNIGCIGRHGSACSGHAGMLDFNDMAFTPDGRVAISYTDACVRPACKDSNTSQGAAGVLAIQTDGPHVG